MLDFSRTQVDKINYQVIEDLKNGRYFSTKYVSEMRVYKPPHVVCFANSEPNFVALSTDRWVCCNLTEDALDTYLRALFPISAASEESVRDVASNPQNYYGSPMARVSEAEEPCEEDNLSQDSLLFFETQRSLCDADEDDDVIPASGRPSKDGRSSWGRQGEEEFGEMGREEPYGPRGHSCVVRGTDEDYLDEFYAILNLK